VSRVIGPAGGVLAGLVYGPQRIDARVDIRVIAIMSKSHCFLPQRGKTATPVGGPLAPPILATALIRPV
jgi:hypothetical protein